MLTPLEGNLDTHDPSHWEEAQNQPKKKTSFSAEINVPNSDTKCEPTVAIITLNIQCKTTGGKKKQKTDTTTTTARRFFCKR
jgi:hypothetical protein